MSVFETITQIWRKKKNWQGCIPSENTLSPIRESDGKPKGAISKYAQLREDFFKAYQQMRGVQGLLSWAKEHQTEFYMMIFKMLPKTDFPLDTEEATLTYEERLQLVFSESSQGQEEEEEE